MIDSYAGSSKMECIPIKGFQGGDLIYIPKEKHLYVRKSNISGKSFLVCYDTVAYKDTDIDKDDDYEFVKCSARCMLDVRTGKCHRNSTPHTDHDDHEIKFHDLQSLNAMKEHCRYLAKNFPFSARKIPIKEIFLSEMSK